jgi:tRNA (guanine37-N1)-methyltransferase
LLLRFSAAADDFVTLALSATRIGGLGSRASSRLESLKSRYAEDFLRNLFMKIDVLTIFPELFNDFLNESLLGKSIKKGIIDIRIIDIRSFTQDKHKTTDDKPYGGGCGMVMKIEPIYNTLKSIRAIKSSRKNTRDPYIVLMSPQGNTLTQAAVKLLSRYKRLVLICGHYEGIDERITNLIDEEISIGDYVLNGGEIPAMTVIESVARMLPEFAKERMSVENDSFFNGMLDWPCYTRPAVFKGLRVPEVLLSGNHKEIEAYRKRQALINTKKKKPYILQSKGKF